VIKPDLTLNFRKIHAIIIFWACPQVFFEKAVVKSKKTLGVGLYTISFFEEVVAFLKVYL